MSEITRRVLLVRGAAVAATLAGGAAVARAALREAGRVRVFEFGGEGPGWPGWRTAGVANLRREGGEGILEAGSDVFPNDPRPVAFAVGGRMRDGAITAEITRPGVGPGVVLRRTEPTAYYAAAYDGSRPGLRILRRLGEDLVELARVSLASVRPPLTLTLAARGAEPTRLRAELVDADGRHVEATASDSTPLLQRAGDAGVLATAQTLFPSERNPVLPALGNIHLLPWSVQEGQAFMATALGEAIVAEIGRASTAAFRRITVSSGRRLGPARPSVIAATTGTPVRGGARLQVALDGPARVELEISRTPSFRSFRTLDAGTTNRFWSTTAVARGLPPGRRFYWRARARRGAGTTVGPTRSFRVPPAPGSGQEVTVAVGACASQFGPIFDRLAEVDPDVFVWQGDLNYPDTHGPLAQTTAGYAGIWRDFLANPRLAPILSRSCFAAQRDDHDYGVQDADRASIEERPWGIGPWDGLIDDRPYYRFRYGLLEIWVLDQRRFKVDADLPDTPEKTLLGARQRRWLLRTLAASRAPFKLICSPVTVTDPLANPRDGNWGAGFTAERDLILDHIARRVGGRTLFLTGDTHVTMVRDHEGVFEARACPLDIPEPRDTTLVQPLYATQLAGQPGVAYASSRSHFSIVRVHGRGSKAILEYSIVREDGWTPYRKRFEAGRSATLARS